MRADLHIHSTASDGLNEPKENVELAKEMGLAAIALTDHDSIAGLDEAIEAGKELGVEVIPGIEVSTLDKGQDVHILGYYIQYKNREFLNTLEELQQVREKRNIMMLEKLNGLGIEITMDEVLSKLKRADAHVGRPHIGEVLIEKGIVDSMEEAFEKYLGKDGRAYVNPIRISPEEGIDIIRRAGGVPVLAHPGLYDDDELVLRLINYGIAGIEVYHPDNDEEDEKRYFEMAKKYSKLMTAGSDYHGSRKEVVFHAPIGTKTVPYETVELLKVLAKQD